MKYWVIIDDRKIGPLSADELGHMRICPDTPVWRPGLADWCRASELQEISSYISHGAVPPPITPVPPMPNPRIMYSSQIPGAPAQRTDPRNQAPMPSTYLVWSIIVTLLCCVPCGVVAIYYSAQVSSRYETGDIKGAEQASERAQLWIILSIVLGLIATPFIMLSML
ncbi:MAG: CD225/dispanin family protein [Paramuribaculum sp.]|nr:CD225/dispanin family protein [Paramuribaculum sp.]